MSLPGTLYIVATPIGNLGDISLRALEILKQVDYVAAEDTRHTRRLLTHFSISQQLISLHDYNEEQRCARLLEILHAGKQIALVSDAGTPLISDPGFVLVRLVREAGYHIVPIPGACALITALVACGLPTDRFVFEGFLPTKEAAREQRLQELVNEPRTLIFYEAVHRIVVSLTSMLAVFGGQRLAVIARELTKRFETIRAGTLAELLTWLTADPMQQRGEFVVIVHGLALSDSVDIIESKRILTLLMAELPLKQSVNLATQICCLPKNRLYELALELQKTEKHSM